MATSLAAQLKKLAVPETQSLLSGDYRQASFLYDDGEAATFDKQHFYNIGINGLQQLSEKDDRFIEFEQNLFSPSSQSLQRYVQTAETNKQLDETIVKFLLRLSPYMQLREAHKAMEWMVHRYNVHLRNVDTLMMCVLPYHDQEPFIMALQLLNMNSNECAKWRWLEPVKKGRTFLPRQTLVTHCRAAKGFLGFICDMLSNHIEANTDDNGTPSARHLQRVISFYTQTVLAVLRSGPPSESILSTLIPAITAGLKSHDLPDHMMSSYMILSQLFTQTSLAKTLLDSFLNVIAKNAQANLLHSAVTVLVIMFQKQDISKVSKKAFKYLSRHPSLTQILAGLSRESKTERFLTPFMAVLTQRALKESTGNTMTSDSNPEDEDDSAPLPLLSLLMDILTVVPLEKETIAVVSRGVLTWFSENREGTAMETDDQLSQSDGAFRVFRLLENRFSSILDTVVNELISHDESGEMANVVKTLLITSVESAQQDLKSDPQSCVAVCLHHQNANVRKSAVEKLLQNTNLMDDISSVQAAIALRLEDDDASVVSAVLENPQGLWELFEDKSLLYQTLQKKLRACGGKKGRNDTRSQVLKTLCCVPEDVAPTMEVTACVLSFLVALDENEIDLVESLLQSPVTVWNKLLAHVETEWLPNLQQHKKSKTKESKLGGLCLKLVESVTSHLMSNSQEAQVIIENLHTSMAATPRQGSLALLLLLVTQSMIKRVRKLEVKMGLQRQLMVLLSDFMLCKHLIQPSKIVIEPETGKSSSSKKELNADTSLSQLAVKGTLPVGLITDLLTHVEFVPLPSKLKDLKFWELSEKDGLESDWLRTVTLGGNLLLDMAARKDSRVSAVGRESFKLVFSVLTDTKSVVRLLCMLWMANEKQGVTSTHKAHTLQFATVFFNSLSDAEKTKLAEDPTPILPCLLILLSSQSEQVREVAFTLLTSLAGDTSSDSSNFKWFAGNLLRYKQEVTKDNAFLAQVLKNILEGEESSLSPSSPKKRKRTSSKPLPYSVTLTYLLDVICDQQTSSKVKAGLLAVLHKLDTSESFLPLMPLLKDLVSKPVPHQSPPTSPSSPPPPSVALSALTVEEREMVALLLKRFTTTVAACIQESNASLQALLAALSCPWAIKDSGDTVQMAALEQLSSKFMSALPYQSRQAVFTRVLDVMSADSSVELTKHCRKVIKHMTVESSLIVDEFKSVLAKSSAGTIREAKRQKLQQTGQSEESELDSLPWKRVTMLLEMVQSKKKVSSPVLLIPVAFQVLGKVLELENKGSGEYTKQLLLGTVNNICSRNKDSADGDSETDTVKGEHLNMELIVQCIRSSDNQHTHQQALLLLSSAAKIAPGLLLHNMMSVFTFMGANILRQDDAYSFHVIGRILENVIPALIMACEEKSKDKPSVSKKKTPTKSATSKGGASQIKSEDMMTVVLRVFVDAIPHIPAHRKIMLFEKLVSVVGADSYLWRLILLFIESVTVRPSKSATDGEAGDSMSEDGKSSGPLALSDLEFLISLIEEFSSSQLLQCFQQVLAYVLELPEDKPSGQSLHKSSKETQNVEDMTAEEMEIFSVPYHTAKQLRHFKYATIFALDHLVTCQHLVAQMAEVDPATFLPSYQSLMETVLQFIGQVTQSHDRHRETASARFWRILLHKSHDFLEHLVNLLPDSMFMEVVSGLMNHSLPLVQRRSMELLNTKLQHYKDNLAKHQVEMLLGMTTKLQSIVHQCLLQGNKDGSTGEEVVNGQTALYSLKILCRILGDKNHKPFLEVLRQCVKVLSRHHDNGMVSASAMLCLAEVVSTAKVHTIEYLGEFVPLLISQLQSETITRHEVLLLAAVTSLQKVIESLPLFLSPYLLDIIVQVCIISSVVESQSHKPAVGQKIKLICSTLATVTPTRTFLPVLEKSFIALEDKMASCAECAMSMLKDHVVKMSREDLTTFSHDLLKFFFVCFDIRATHEEISESDLDVIEGRVIEAFVSLVFKLSEAQFKPMLLQLYTWATDEEASRERVLVFYRLCDSLAEKLKNLFTLFAGHILKHSAETLDTNNKNKNKCKYFGKGKMARRKSCRLLCYIVDCLQKTFAHDTEGFLNKERFDVVMQPLVDQLENELGKDSVSEDRVTKHVVPCIASLAASAHDDSLWKDLNYQILLKTRHESPKVRIWALAAVDAFHKQLGEDYTQLVPETIPFMAELMEDESDEVEKYTQKVLANMEVSVGENLQEYF